MNNIIELLKNSISPQLLSDISSTTGESSDKISTTISSIFPVLLWNILKKSNIPDELENIFNALKSAPGIDTVAIAPTHSVGTLTENNELTNTGTQFLKTILGDKLQSITSLLTTFSGIKSSSVSTLLSVATSVTMGIFSKKITENGQSPTSFLSFLNSQTNNIISAIPENFVSTLGVTELKTPPPQTNNMEEGKSKSKHLVKPTLALLVVLLLALFAWAFHTTPQPSAKNNTNENTQSKGLSTARNITDSALSSQMYSLKKLLPDGIELNIPQFGVESKLLTAIEEPADTIDKMGWFSFDRLNFKTGSATLLPDSHAQLKNIADILIAYPKVTLKLGGYTDNTGTPEDNLKLSQERADSVRNALIDLGINGTRLQTEGYGQEHPVASNNTAEGREKNRRIDIRILTK